MVLSAPSMRAPRRPPAPTGKGCENGVIIAAMKKSYFDRRTRGSRRVRRDGILSAMQTPAARKGMVAGFNATPAELGRAAVMAARKRP